MLKIISNLSALIAFLFSALGLLATELNVPNNGINIAGEYQKPLSVSNDAPLVIMLSGSGAQDRDETVFGFKPFKLIADALNEKGIPSYRYDDRQVGGSGGVFADATLEDLSNDVLSIISHFKSEHGYKSFVLLGHSQGGIVAAEAAAGNPDISGVILMASPTIMLKDVISEQVRIMQLAGGKSQEAVDQVLAFQETAYAAVADNSKMPQAKAAFTKLVEYEVSQLPPAQQAMVGDVNTLAENQFKATMAGMTSPQMGSLLFHDPSQNLANISVPILALFGGKDTQVPATTNKSALEMICGDPDKDCQIIVIEDANHLFQSAKTGLADEYSQLPKEFNDKFLPAILGWMERLE